MHKPVKYAEKGLTYVARGGWAIFERINRVRPNPSFTPKWSEKPLLKSYQKTKPPLGWPRTTDSLCPKCIPIAKHPGPPSMPPWPRRACEPMRTSNHDSQRILVVDDTEANRYALTRYLRGAGYEVWEAHNGREGLRRAEEQPDLVILDVRMPDILGFEVCAQLKQNPQTATPKRSELAREMNPPAGVRSNR